jgi:hypothetical protein
MEKEKYLIGKKIGEKLIVEGIVSSSEVRSFAKSLVEMWQEDEDTEADIEKFVKLINEGETDLLKYESVVPNFMGYDYFLGKIKDEKIIINGEKYNMELTK